MNPSGQSIGKLPVANQYLSILRYVTSTRCVRHFWAKPIKITLTGKLTANYAQIN